MTFKVKEGVQVGSTLALDANGKLTTGLSTGRSISLSGDVAGSATFDGTSNITISTTVQANSVALGTDTTGNYMVDVTAGTGVSVSHTQAEGSTATISIGQAVATTSNVTFANINASGNLVIDGDLTVNGTTTTISASNLAIEDNLIYLNEGSTVANPDLGITGNYNDGTYAHAGVFRDATDNRWKFFKGYTPEPSTSIDTTHASFAYADVQAATFYGALSGNVTGNVTGNASTASAWQTARTLSYTGDATGSMSVNGSANVSTALTLANSGVTAGSYGSGTAIPVLTIDAKGRVTAASTSAVTIGDGAMTVTAGSGLTGGGQVGTANQTSASSVTISHADTSSVANVTAATNTFISGITFDTYGHVQTVTTGAPSGFASSTHYHDRIYNGASGSSSYLALNSTNELEYYNASGVIDTLYLQYSGTAAQLKGPGGAQIWMDSNDGSGSGLDADLLDGQHGSYYAPNSSLASYVLKSGDTMTGALTINSAGSYPLQLSSSQRYQLRIRNTAATAQTAGWWLAHDGGGSLYFHADSTGDRAYLTSAGAFGATTFEAPGTTGNRGGYLGNLHVGYGSSYNTIQTPTNADTVWLQYSHSGNVGLAYGGGYTTAYGSIRSPIFYDSNDTNYYVDPASTSSLLRTYIKGYNNSGYVAFNNASTYWGLIGNYGTNDWRLGWGDVGALTGWGMRWDAAGNAWSNASHRAPIFYDNDDTGYYLDPNSYSRIRQLTVTNARVDSSKYPIGHYAPGQEVFAIDPTWTQDQLREYFNSNSVSWVADSTAPGGYAISISGGVSVGNNSYSSGFPWIPVETDDTFYMECYIKDVTGTNTHYMGSIDFNESFGNLGGNPGSYGYWVMAGYGPGTSWTKVSGYISGFGTSTGQFKIGTKYWTPQALFNYSGGGTSYISGWRVYRLAKGIVGRFPNSTTNSGEAWYGRANDRNRGTFTIQLGGGSSSGRTFEVVDYAWSSVMFSVDSGNYASAAGSFRAPIFYDSNNTGYYVDPNSVSVLNDTRLCAGNTQIVTNNVGNNTKWRALAGSSDLGISFYDAGDNWRMQLYASSGNYGFLNGNWASWDFRKVPSGALYLNNQSTYYYTHDTTYVYRVYGTADIRSPIFYDNDNTGYYVDPASTTYINVLTTAGNITSNSDIRLKRDIQKITNATDKVKKLNGVTFTRIDVEDTTKRYAGLIAQEVLEVLPEAVEGTATYSVAYGNMVGLLVEAIKEQQSEIDELKALVKQLLAK